jgi:hypothetical protein
MSRLERATATGLIQAGPLYLKSVVLQGGSANSTALLQDTAAGGGADLLGLAALANSSEGWQSGAPRGVYFRTGLYLTLSGTGASVTVEYEQ